MAEEHHVTLKCCGVMHKIIINECAVLEGDLEESRKNIICHNCDRLVVLSFRRRGNFTSIDQEVV